MAAYATISDIKSRCEFEVNETICNALLEDAAVIIDSYNADADVKNKKIVSCRMVIRALPSGDSSFPIGATQGTVSALGYSQTFTMGTGNSTGELYLEKLEKKLLGVGPRIGTHSVLED